MVVQLALSALLFVSVNYAEAQVQAPSAYFSLPAKAQFYPLLGRRFVARCRMDWCHWLRLENVRLIGRSSKGELYAVSSNSWTSGPHRGWTPPKTSWRAPRDHDSVDLIANGGVGCGVRPGSSISRSV